MLTKRPTTRFKNWSIAAELREYVLSDETSVDDIAFFTRKGLILGSGHAAVAKICPKRADPISRREENAGNQKRPYTTIGIPATFSARLQPNDTRDDVQSIAAQIYEGLSSGWAMR